MEDKNTRSDVMKNPYEHQERQEYWHNKYMRCHNRNRNRKKNKLNVSRLARKKNRGK